MPVQKKRKGAKREDEEPYEDDEDDEVEETDEDEDDESEADDDDDDEEEADEDTDTDTDDDDDDEEADDDEDDDDEAADDDDDDEEDELQGPVSLSTDDAEAGGGLPQDIRCKFTDWRFRVGSKSDYTEDGDLADTEDSLPLLSCTATPRDKAAGDPFELHISMGSLARSVPSKTGQRNKPSRSGPYLIPAKGTTVKGTNTSSNGYYFLKSMEDAGLPKGNRWPKAHNLSSLEGLDAHLIRVPQPKRKGLRNRDEEEEKSGYEKTMPAISKIYSIPWKKGAGVKAKASGKVAKAEPEPEKKVKRGPGRPRKSESEYAGVSVAVEKQAKKLVLQAIKKAGRKGTDKDRLYPMVFEQIKRDPNRKTILDLIKQDSFLEEGPWNFDAEDGTLTSA